MTYNLPFNKVTMPANHAQVELLRSFDNFICSASGSQLMKRLDATDVPDLVDALKKGERVEVID